MPDRPRLSPHPPLKPLRTIAALALLAVGAAGCTRSVAIDDPVPPPAALAVCAALMAALPTSVADQARRTVQPGRYAAAWGDPTITLRCGVAKPTGTSDCIEVDDVGWTPLSAEGGAIFTTYGRRAYVQVGVPSAYAPEPTVLVDLGTAIRQHVPAEQDCT